jgi:hypothetical protein
MLVKELRQGLRTYTFVILFLLLQGVLALVLLVASGATADTSATDRAGEVVSQIVFCFYALALLVAQPLRGISALSTEIRQNTIELLVLTRLSAWRIVTGKWASIVSQSALILVAVLPYLILRYFFGGMQLFAELLMMLYLFLLSGVLTAFTVGISGAGSALIRGLVVVVGAPLLSITILSWFVPSLPDLMQVFGLNTGRDALILLGILALSTFVGYFFLEVGTSAIAPRAENRATLKRLLGLAAIIVSYTSVQFADPDFALAAALVIAGLVSLDLFTEPADFPSVVCAPFLRLGSVGKLLGRFLYPGWATGIVFFCLLAGVIVGLLALGGATMGVNQGHYLTTGMTFAVLAFPAAITQLFARKAKDRFTIYVSLMLTGWLLALILGILFREIKDEFLLWLFTPVPMVLFPAAAELAGSGNRDTLLAVSWGLAGLYALVVLAGAGRHLAAIGKLERHELADEESAR